MKTIAYCNIKGGTGKSTLSLLTARILTQIGRRVLFIDSDPQNAATFFLTNDIPSQSLHRVYLGEDVINHILPVEWGFKLIPSDINLMKLGNISDNALANILKNIDDDFDYCIIDGLPYYNVLMRNAMHAADLIVVPTTADVWGHKVLHFMLKEMSEMYGERDLLVVLNMWQPLSKSENVFQNRMGAFFADDELIRPFLADTHIYRSSPIYRIIQETGYKIMAPKALFTITSHVAEVTGEDESVKLREVG